MILYDYECTNCLKQFEAYNTIELRHYYMCPTCGETGKLLITNTRTKDWFYPHWNENLDINPIYVKSRNHFKELCKEKGLYSKALGPIDDKRGC